MLTKDFSQFVALLREHGADRLRQAVVFVFRSATYVNIVCGVGLLILLPILPELFGILLIPFYCLIWGVLPAWCLLGVAICIRSYNRMPVKGHFKTEIKWGLQVVGSYALLIVLLWVFSAVVS